MRLEIDRRRCTRSQQCSYLHPELFGRDAEDFPLVLTPTVPPAQREAAEEAVDLCPVSAITLHD